MWTAAENSMLIGTESTVNTAAAQLMTLTAFGQAKLLNPLYTPFLGKHAKYPESGAIIGDGDRK